VLTYYGIRIATDVALPAGEWWIRTTPGKTG